MAPRREHLTLGRFSLLEPQTVDCLEFGSTRCVFRLSLSTRLPYGRLLVETESTGNRPSSDPRKTVPRAVQIPSLNLRDRGVCREGPAIPADVGSGTPSQVGHRGRSGVTGRRTPRDVDHEVRELRHGHQDEGHSRGGQRAGPLPLLPGLPVGGPLSEGQIPPPGPAPEGASDAGRS